jgi:hypothetical protein
MASSFLCRLFGCNTAPKTFSAKIEANQGFDSPEPIAGLNGWTVWKQSQTEIYVIEHNLGLSEPDRQLHIVATTMTTNTIVNIESIESNRFRVSTWLAGSAPAPVATAFMFVATRQA